MQAAPFPPPPRPGPPLTEVRTGPASGRVPPGEAQWANVDAQSQEGARVGG